jgi:hypothetical protein
MIHHSSCSRPGRAGCAAALAALVLAAALGVTPARAASGAPDEAGSGGDEGWKKVFSFAHCAVNVFRAVSPAEWTLAIIDCSRLFLEEPPLPGGSRP